MKEQAPLPEPLAEAQAHRVLAGDSPSKTPEGLAAVVGPQAKLAGENGLAQKRGFLWKVHSYTSDYIRFADTKAAFCVGIASALIGALFVSKSHNLFLTATPSQYAGHWTVLGVVSLGAFLLLGISFAAAVMVVRPRLWTHSEKGFIFWEAVSAFDGPGTFATQYKAQTEDELLECLSHHLYSLAKICTRKYFWVSIAILSAVGGAVLAVIVLLLK